MLDKKGLWIKTGQYLGTRADVMPAPFIKELSKLQDTASPSPFTHVRKVVLEELKKPLEDIFTSFDENPLAAASIGQVHKAQLKSGQRVVVKVQHGK